MAVSTADRLVEVLERWEAVIGLEIHTELTTLQHEDVLRLPGRVRRGAEHARVPGVPRPARRAAGAQRGGHRVHGARRSRDRTARSRAWSQFHRKKYFYPDMPKDYQISQYDLPFCSTGHVEVEVEGEGAQQRVDRDGTSAAAADAAEGDALHDAHRHHAHPPRRGHRQDGARRRQRRGGIAGATQSLVDFNRAGTPLIELVTEPDIRTPEEARRFAQKLRLIWLSLGISDCNMEEGSHARRRERERPPARRDRARHQGRGQEHELVQGAARRAGLRDRPPGRGCSRAAARSCRRRATGTSGAKRTSSLRSKEEAHDYRYFPEPDMVPFEFSDEFIDEHPRAPARAARRQAARASWPTTACRRTTRPCSPATSTSPSSSRPR